MRKELFRVIARAPGRDEDAYDNIGAALARTFKLDLTEVAVSLAEDGVVVAEVSTFAEGRVYANRVREMGADSLVLDPDGKLVEQTGSPRARISEHMLDSMMMGGYQAAGEAPLSPLRAEEDLISLDDSGGLVALPPSAPAATMGPMPELSSLEDTDLGPLGLADTPAVGQSGGFSMDHLDENSLMMLDGSTDDAPASASGAAPGGMALDPQGGRADFAPPPDDELLELDDAVHVHAMGVSSMASEEQEQRPAQPPPAPTGAHHFPLESGSSTPRAVEARQNLDHEPPPVEGETEAEVEWVPAEGEAGPRLSTPRPTRAMPPPPVTRPSREQPAVGWRGAVQWSRSPLDLPRELARSFPRLRIIIGFALALSFGAIAPTCHAGSVIDRRIQPLLVDLSTARAHGQLLMSAPGYRSPEELEQQISSVKTRHGVYAFLMWLVIGGGLGFAWFRLVRTD